ncbi:uncharacterized protein LOC105685677 isoform X1 [Athalia rosae]|uniref:uncharacterized protein LOC105685677 isoform X1 n=2 Tax=Athalia rosae TaxID=37344 RepID=UPI002033E631|nr:uncharacterized protein LOC105685677 isoform X1 [Athalia rosae]
MSRQNSSESLGYSKLFDPCDKIPDFKIGDSLRKALCFQERLIVSLKDNLTSDTKPVGGYCISVEGIGSEGQEFMIQVLSSLTVNDRFAGLKVIGSTTAKLHCLEEKRTEYVQKCDGLHEKIIFFGLKDDIYHLEGEDSCPRDKSCWKKDLPLCSNGDIITEGTSVLLMRYLALTNYHGNLSFQSIMIDGQLATSNYRCSEATHMKYHGHVIKVYMVERKIQEECGLIHNIKTYMTRNGYILRHDWLEEQYLLQINPLIDPNILGTNQPKISAPLRSRWGSDVEILSMYLDTKVWIYKIISDSTGLVTFLHNFE